MTDSSTLSLAWGKKVSADFRARVFGIAFRRMLVPDYLMACMAFETGERFTADVRNAAGSGATGLIQFMPATARALGTTTEKLRVMTAEEQLEYVEEYFTPYTGRLKTLSDHYMAILLPKMIGRPESAVLFSGGVAYRQNAGLDIDHDGKVTKYEAAWLVRAKLEKGLKPEYRWSESS